MLELTIKNKELFGWMLNHGLIKEVSPGRWDLVERQEGQGSLWEEAAKRAGKALAGL